MISKDNLRIVEQVFEAFNAHDAERLAQLHQSSAVVYRAVTDPLLKGNDEIRDWFDGIFTGFPDCRWTKKRTFGQGDLICVEWTFTGSHKDKPNKSIQTWDCGVFKIEGRRIVEGRFYYDLLSATKQLEAE